MKVVLTDLMLSPNHVSRRLLTTASLDIRNQGVSDVTESLDRQA